MPFKDVEKLRAWKRDYRRRERLEARRSISLHKQLGIETYVHRQAILDDPRIGRRYDRATSSWNHQHPYRENITLARV